MIFSKNTKIFLIAFSAILIVITVFMIWYTNTHKGTDELQVIVEDVPKSVVQPSEISKIQEDTTEGVFINEDFYNCNDITYEYKSEQIKNIDVTYPIIDGLKDESVENSINSQIKDRIIKIFDSNNFRNNSDTSAYAEAVIVGNFADVLSVKIFVKFNESFGKNYGVSFSLESGSRIKLEDLFTADAPKKNIITSSAYRSFAMDYYTQEGLSNDFYANIESDLLNFMIDYNAGKVAEFSFTPMVIEIYREGRTILINMQDYAEHIAIYKRFLTMENIYSSAYNNAKGVPVFVERPNSIIDLYERVNDNCIIDVIISGENSQDSFSDKEMNTIENYKKDLVSRLENVKRESGIFYSNYVIVSKRRNNGEDILIFSENEKYAIADKNEFLSSIYNKILLAQRDITSDYSRESAINVLDTNMILASVAERRYSIETEKEIKQEQEDNSQVQENVDDINENVVSEDNVTDSFQNVTNSTNEVNRPSNGENEVNITTQVFF